MSVNSYAPDWNLPKVQKVPVPIDSLSKSMVGPYHKYLLTRTYVIYAIMVIAGILPSILARAGMAVPAWLQSAAFGLWFPGAGLIATGTIQGIILGIVFILFVRKFTVLVWKLTGLMILNTFLWAVSLVGAGFLGGIIGRNTPYYAWIINVIVLVVIFYNKNKMAKGAKAAQLKSREGNIAWMNEHPEKFVVNEEAGLPIEERELTKDQVDSIRYVYEMTLNREYGDFSGYEESEGFQSSALRYTLDHLGYTLMLAQSRYLPNFQGYINDAQRHIIESFTHPDVCSYWKWEYAATFLRWNPDPIRYMNIMFSGWTGVLPIIYERNTGDTRYEEDGAFKFKTSKKSEKTYDYNMDQWIEEIYQHYENLPSKLIPCEPYFVFPICNGWGFASVLAYDRLKGTDHLAKYYPELKKKLDEDWSNPDGTYVCVKNSLLGSYSGNASPMANAVFGVQSSWVFNAIDPQAARKEYELQRYKWFYHDESGELKTRLGDWDKLADMGNFKPGCGYIIGVTALAAREMGDDEFAEELLAVADKYLTRAEGSSYHYKNASVISNSLLTMARFLRVNDFAQTIWNGPGRDLSSQPILEKCSFPDVLVAKAFSNGDDLELVLFNGEAAGQQKLGLARLEVDKAYRIEQTGETFTADASGNAEITVMIDGRTPIHVVPA